VTPPQTPLGELTVLPQTLQLDLRGSTSKARGGRKREERVSPPNLKTKHRRCWSVDCCSRQLNWLDWIPSSLTHRLSSYLQATRLTAMQIISYLLVGKLSKLLHHSALVPPSVPPCQRIRLTIYSVGQKTGPQTHDHNSVKS